MSAFIRANRSALTIQGGELDGRALSSEDVQRLADMPSRDELVATLLMRMNGPISGLVNVLNGPIGGLARVLQGRIDNMQEQGA